MKHGLAAALSNLVLSQNVMLALLVPKGLRTSLVQLPPTSLLKKGNSRFGLRNAVVMGVDQRIDWIKVIRVD